MLARCYLLLALLGALIPWLFFIDFFAEFGIHIPSFIAALFANGAVVGFTADLLISSVAFWLFMFAQRAKSQDAPMPFLFILLNLSTGLSCALPAYLYASTRRVSKASLKSP